MGSDLTAVIQRLPTLGDLLQDSGPAEVESCETGESECNDLDLAQDQPDPWESDRCLKALLPHLPSSAEIPLATEDPLFGFGCNLYGKAFGDAVTRTIIAAGLEWMREFLHITPKGIRGRPRGSGMKPNTDAAWKLWKEGKIASEICRELGIPQKERNRLYARLRQKLKRLPEHERCEVLEARLHAKNARKQLHGLFDTGT